jgi:hypothetical protein
VQLVGGEPAGERGLRVSEAGPEGGRGMHEGRKGRCARAQQRHPAHPVWVVEDRALHDLAAPRVPRKVGVGEAESVQQGNDVRGENVQPGHRHTPRGTMPAHVAPNGPAVRERRYQRVPEG